tara:strand:- start:616 stop:1923 length:1308 start_codon:yes stop_codon:yes gene_type:complete
MSLTNIAALFSDIVETPQQRQQRLLAEGQASAGQFTGLPTGIRELAMGISSNIPRNVEAVRRFGVQAGLPMQTQGEAFQSQLKGLDLQTKAGQKEAVRITTNIDPLRGAALAETFAQQARELADRERINQLRDLQIKGAIRTEGEEIESAASIAENATRLREEGVLPETVISAYETEGLSMSQIESIRSGMGATGRAKAAEQRAITLFDNQLTIFSQNQADRTNNIGASNNFKGALLTRVLEKEPNHPFVELLESDAIIPIERLAQMQKDFNNEIKPNVAYQQIYDSSSGQNVIAAIDRDTNEMEVVAEAPRTSSTDRDIPIMSAAAETAIQSMIESKMEWENLPGLEGGIYNALGNEDAAAGRNALINLVHSYSESQNIPIARVLNMINNQIFMQDGTINTDGLARLKAGYLIGNPTSTTLTPEEQALLEKFNG